MFGRCDRRHFLSGLLAGLFGSPGGRSRAAEPAPLPCPGPFPWVVPSLIRMTAYEYRDGLVSLPEPAPRPRGASCCGA
jgi:hypothetical protein